jgi:formate hydrogenlyase subunit 3/multisubunit Na+/H+ antiporter MnhD subunit
MVISFALIDKIVFGLLAAGALGALFCSRKDRLANIIGVASCVMALSLKITVLFSGDMLAGCFQLPIIVVGVAGALHSVGYMAKHGVHRMSGYWFLYNMMIGSMLAVTMCKPGLAFVAAWELMGLSSFALVAFDWKKSQVRQAAWIYLLSCELGGLLLVWILAMSYFNGMQISAGAMTAVTMIAFGLKAGFPLLHVWLPEAHPAAPAPVSAVMSAAMIPLGFYGIL